MALAERFSNLPEYAFPRLRALLEPHAPSSDVARDPITMTIGEPRHPFPDWVGAVLAEHLPEFGSYPPNDGTPHLLSAIAGWVVRRYGVHLDPAHRILALNGTREGLFNGTLALCPEQKRGQVPLVLIPNPFYQAYAVGALAAGAEPLFVPATAATGFLPDYAGLPAAVLDRVAIAWVCSPSNPQGAVAPRAYWSELLALAEKHDFMIFADECYAELWRGAPPPGGLEMAAAAGADPERMFVFHSLSKRSNMPGLRSGFLAGGPKGIAAAKQLRSYGGAPLPLPLQRVSERLWADEAHVVANRVLYAEKFADADRVFQGVQGYRPPQAGFFLWLPVDDGEAAAIRLWTEAGVKVLPGAYLGRDIGGENPGAGYVRVALVAPRDEAQRGLTRLRNCLYG